MIGRSGERRSGISVLAARHDDDADDFSPVLVVKYKTLSLDIAEVGTNRIWSISLRLWPGHLRVKERSGLVNLCPARSSGKRAVRLGKG